MFVRVILFLLRSWRILLVLATAIMLVGHALFGTHVVADQP